MVTHLKERNLTSVKARMRRGKSDSSAQRCTAGAYVAHAKHFSISRHKLRPSPGSLCKAPDNVPHYVLASETLTTANRLAVLVVTFTQNMELDASEEQRTL